jgi:PAS domain S-box-containing protein
MYWSVLGVYCLINLALIGFQEERLRSGRMRLFAECLDIVLISALILISHDVNSSLFLFYLFPILAAARYKRARIIASFVIVIYLGLVIAMGATWAVAPTVLMRCLVFMGIAYVARNLTKDRQLSEINLVKLIREVTLEIIRHPEQLEQVYTLILDRALEISGSKRGHMRMVDSAGTSRIVAHKGLPVGYEEQFFAFTGGFSDNAIRSKSHIIITRLSKKQIKQRLSSYFDERFPPPRSALFVPLFREAQGAREVIAVIAAYSETDIFYSAVDVNRIQTFAPLLEVAEAFHNLYCQAREEARQETEEKQRRLQMLHELAKHFEKGQLSTEPLQELIVSIMQRLNAEEAAIFLWDKKTGRVVKKAEASPDDSITAQLRQVERSYGPKESLTGEAFFSSVPIYDNDLSPRTQYAEEYSNYLPSRKVSHIMVIPLLVGENKIGVLRIINRKAPDYDMGTNPALKSGGFSADDQNLSHTLAIQVAVALNSKDLLEQVDTNRRFLEHAIEYSPFPTILLDEKGKIKNFNHECERIWQLTGAEAVGKSVIGFYETEDEARRLGRLLDEAEEGQIVDVDAVVKDASGASIPIRLSASLIKDDDGNKIGSIGVFKDLRDIKSAEELKLSTERLEAISRVMGHVSHDVKNKLIAAALNVATLKKQLKRGDKEKVENSLVGLDDTLEVAINKLTNIALTQSFDIHRPAKRLIYVEEIFNECLERWTRLAALSGTSLSINEYTKERYRILVDVDQIQMVLTNLYDNSAYAIKKADGTGDREIKINVRATGDQLEIVWLDTGCGIPRSELSRVFDIRFTTKEFGNGLGLYWAKNIIQNHDGNIIVNSQEGAWTKFIICFPLLLTEEANATMLS